MVDNYNRAAAEILSDHTTSDDEKMRRLDALYRTPAVTEDPLGMPFVDQKATLSAQQASAVAPPGSPEYNRAFADRYISSVPVQAGDVYAGLPDISPPAARAPLPGARPMVAQMPPPTPPPQPSMPLSQIETTIRPQTARVQQLTGGSDLSIYDAQGNMLRDPSGKLTIMGFRSYRTNRGAGATPQEPLAPYAGGQELLDQVRLAHSASAPSAPEPGSDNPWIDEPGIRSLYEPGSAVAQSGTSLGLMPGAGAARVRTFEKSSKPVAPPLPQAPVNISPTGQVLPTTIEMIDEAAAADAPAQARRDEITAAAAEKRAKEATAQYRETERAALTARMREIENTIPETQEQEDALQKEYAEAATRLTEIEAEDIAAKPPLSVAPAAKPVRTPVRTAPKPPPEPEPKPVQYTIGGTPQIQYPAPPGAPLVFGRRDTSYDELPRRPAGWSPAVDADESTLAIIRDMLGDPESDNPGNPAEFQKIISGEGSVITKPDGSIIRITREIDQKGNLGKFKQQNVKYETSLDRVRSAADTEAAAAAFERSFTAQAEEEIAQQRIRQAKVAQNRINEITLRAKKLSDMQVDPQRFFGNKNYGRQVGALVYMMSQGLLGGMPTSADGLFSGQGASTAFANAVNQVNEYVRADVDDQIRNIKTQQDYLKFLQDDLGNLDKEYTMLESASLAKQAISMMKVAEDMKRQGVDPAIVDPAVAAIYTAAAEKQLQADLLEKRAQKDAYVVPEEPKFVGGGGKPKTPDTGRYVEVKGKAYLANSDKVAERIRDTIDYGNAAVSSIDQIIAALDAPQDAATWAQNRVNIISALKNATWAQKAENFMEGDYELIRGTIENPDSWVPEKWTADTGKNVKQRLLAMRATIAGQIDRKLETLTTPSFALPTDKIETGK